MHTDASLAALPSTGLRRKVYLGRNLQLLVAATGAKLWRYRYRIDGREKSISLGKFPETDLAAATGLRDSAEALVKSGVDPSVQRKKDRAAKAPWTVQRADDKYEDFMQEIAQLLYIAVFGNMDQGTLEGLSRKALQQAGYFDRAVIPK